MREPRLLVHDVLRAVAIDPDRAAVDDAPDARVARSLEHGRGGARVAALGPDRVGLDVADVGHRGEMDDGDTALHGTLERRGIRRVADHGRDAALLVMRGLAQVEDVRLVAAAGQDVHDVRADEA